jgi:acetyl esterase/lipase
LEFTMTETLARPPFDPELEAALTAMGPAAPQTLTADMIESARGPSSGPLVDDLLAEHGISRRDITIPGYRGDEITLSVLGRHGRTGFGPVIYFAHGGGMVTGGRFGGVERLVGWIERFDLTCVTVEYRLAPEFPDPYPVEDCYEGLLWTVEQLEELGIDPARVIVAGASAGGGLAAGIALLARDRGAPSLAGQLLISPMLDDRDATVSTRQIDGVGVWDRTSNLTGWTALLGDRRGTHDVSIYAAPARATHFSGLPPAYVECGSAEVFRDEDVAFASALWAAGVQAELHVWAGGFHAFDLLAPHAAVSEAAKAARDNWLDRVLGA